MLRFLSVLAVAGAVFVYFILDRKAPSAEVTYVTSPVEYGRLKEVVTSTGTVDALLTVDISSQVSGRITEVSVNFNDSVEKDQPLAQIDKQAFEARAAEAAAAVEIALAAVEMQEARLKRAAVEIETAKLDQAVHRARVDQANARLFVARSSLKRKEALLKTETISVADIEDDRAEVLTAGALVRETEAQLAAMEQRVHAARAAFARTQAELVGARASVPQRKAALKLAQVELERTTIRTPIDGVIINRNIDAGQTVATALEAPTLFTIAKALRKMVVYVSVDETDIGHIRIGQDAVFTVDAFPDRQFKGKVTEIRKSAKTIQNIVTYTVVIHTENPEEVLFPGMTALVRITIQQSEPGLKIPTSALNYRPSDWEKSAETGNSATVWRLDQGGDPAPVSVVAGQGDASHTILTSGQLEEGDLIIETEIQQPSRHWLLGLW